MNDVLALVSDLIFSTRISSTAAGLGVDCRVVRAVDDLPGDDDPAPRLAIVDLTAEGAIDAIGRLKCGGRAVRVVAFAPHVDAALIEQAREAGADDVLARSAFVKRLADLLTVDVR